MNQPINHSINQSIIHPINGKQVQSDNVSKKNSVKMSRFAIMGPLDPLDGPIRGLI